MVFGLAGLVAVAATPIQAVSVSAAATPDPCTPAEYPVSAGGGIAVDGDDAFKKKVEKALEEIGKTKAGKDVLDTLKNSNNTHTIKETNVPKGSGNTPANGTNAGNGTGTGSTTKWEPNGTEKYDDDVNRDPTAALLHELAHACDADKGARDAGVEAGSGIKKNEIKATGKENEYRKEKGLAERQKYGGKPLPK
jgi:Effector protein